MFYFLFLTFRDTSIGDEITRLFDYTFSFSFRYYFTYFEFSLYDFIAELIAIYYREACWLLINSFNARSVSHLSCIAPWSSPPISLSLSLSRAGGEVGEKTVRWKSRKIYARSISHASLIFSREIICSPLSLGDSREYTCDYARTRTGIGSSYRAIILAHFRH